MDEQKLERWTGKECRERERQGMGESGNGRDSEWERQGMGETECYYLPTLVLKHKLHLQCLASLKDT